MYCWAASKYRLSCFTTVTYQKNDLANRTIFGMGNTSSARSSVFHE